MLKIDHLVVVFCFYKIPATNLRNVIAKV